MAKSDAESGRALDVVIVYAFDSSTMTAAYAKVNNVYYLVEGKIGCFSSNSMISYVYFESSNNSCTSGKIFARERGIIIGGSTTPCTPNMASGLAEAHRMIGGGEIPAAKKGIILFFSDGLMDKNKGSFFFDGTTDYVSKWPVYTFIVGGGEDYNEQQTAELRTIAANSPGGTFNPTPVPDEPQRSVVFSQEVLDVILGSTQDDETPPAPDSGGGTGLVTMKKPRYSKNDVALSSADSLTVLLELNAPSSSGKAGSREGLDLVVVLAINRSREGGEAKLSEVKKAMEFMIMKLTAMDRLSIVSGKTDHMYGLRQCPLRLMTPAGQADLKDLVAGGGLEGSGINLQEGLMEALGVIRGRVHKQGRAANIFFLTDDSQVYGGDALSVDPGEVAVHTFGLGRKAGHELLKNMAKKSRGGTYSFVPDDSSVCAPLSMMLGGLVTIAAQDLQLTLTSKGKDVEAMAVAGVDYNYKQTASVNSRGEKEITISFGTIFSGESRRVSVDFTLRPSNNSTRFNATIAEAQHSYTAQHGALQKQPPRDVLIRRTAMPTAAAGVDAARLHADEVRRQQAVSIDAATALADAGKLEEARYRLQDMLNAVEDVMLDDGGKMVAALRAELLQLIKLTASKELYEELGRPYAFAAVSSHGCQRAAAKGDLLLELPPVAVSLYVTPRMITHLAQAQKFDKDPNTPVPSADEDLQKEIAADPMAPVAGALAFYLDNAIQSLKAIQKIIIAPTNN
uniref:Uncharacterized protein n=1 Tax=Avena sativa TaxID=4498 RepID=A0ACD6A3T4_AVESA